MAERDVSGKVSCVGAAWLTGMPNRLRAYKDLCKVKIALFACFSALTGYVSAAPRLGFEALALIAGVFFLACGSGALNQYQERDIDAFMARTRSRPLPSRRLTPKHALAAALLLIASGLWLMFVLDRPRIAGLGCFAVAWYNGVYTYLKRITAFAVIPGALVGAIAPCLGWVTGGGGFSDRQLWVLCFLFFLWQVPHFWLLLVNHGQDYHRAGLPSLSACFSRIQLYRITLVWTLAVAVSGMLVPLFGHYSPVFHIFLAAAAGWLGWHGLKFFRTSVAHGHGVSLFRRVNVYMFFIMILLTAHGLLGMLWAV